MLHVLATSTRRGAASWPLAFLLCLVFCGIAPAAETKKTNRDAPSTDAPSTDVPSSATRANRSSSKGSASSTAAKSAASGKSNSVAQGRARGAVDDPVVAAIDEEIRHGWEDAQVQPSDEASEGEWCRRVHIDILGRIPLPEETDRHLRNKSAARREQLVERLLSPEYAAEYANNWATIWSNWLIGRGGTRRQERMIDRDGMEQYLFQTFYDNKPYRQMVTELIAARGVNTPGEEDFNGAVNYLLSCVEDNAIQATAKTARLFLGVQVQCTQCHNHPFNTWKQDQFWGMNAFFRQTRALRTFEGRDIVSVRLADEDFAGESGSPKTGEIYFERRDGTMVAVLEPKFLDGTTIPPSGYVDEVNRRDRLAQLVADSPLLPQAIVNRMWAHFLGYGFTRPVDDMGPHNKVTHPALLERVASEFASAGFDLKQLIRWITLSEAYGLSSKPGAKNRHDDPLQGNAPLFSRFYLRQMRPEELYESVVRVSKLGEADASARRSERREWLEQFTISYGTDENDETSTFNGTIPQTLMLMNGELTRRATACEEGTFLHQVLSGAERDQAKVKALYLAALGRPPSKDEAVAAQQVWVARNGNLQAAVQDIWWALLNSNEFILNH